MIESFKHLEEVAAGKDLADVFLAADEQEHAVPAEQILEALRRRRAVMRDCVERGKSGGGQSMGKLVGNEAQLLDKAFREGRTFLDPLTVKAELYALAVMGENSRMGVIVAAPTAGAGGIVPGMLLALEEERNIDPEKTVRALVVAGGIGSIIALSANISGAAGGCQNEVGVASSMGAAGVSYMMGGTTRQSIRIAEGLLHLEMIETLADDQFHRLPGGLDGGGKLAPLTLELRCLLGAVANRDRTI
jgi:L-serine dehydratase